MSTRSIFFWAVATFLGFGSLHIHAIQSRGNEIGIAGSSNASNVKVPVTPATEKKRSLQEQLDEQAARIKTIEARLDILMAAMNKVPSCANLKDSQFTLNTVCKTSKNQCFKVVHDDAFGIGIQEMGDDCKHEGTIWARQLQQTDVTYDTAQNACPKGTHPPTPEEFTRLRSSVGTVAYKGHRELDVMHNKELLSDPGRKELRALLPDMQGNLFWSLSSQPIYFIGTSGGLYSVDHPHINSASVLCVH